jgi:tRNA (guanine-N7-)-methyltransferase
MRAVGKSAAVEFHHTEPLPAPIRFAERDPTPAHGDRYPRYQNSRAMRRIGTLDGSRYNARMSKIDTPDHTNSAPEYMRRIRSFVLREGRMTPAQQRAFDTLWSRYGIDYHGIQHDFAANFGRHAPRVLEIGFGNGEALAWASEHDLARDFLGVEVHGPGVGRLMNALAARDAGNVRLYKHDAVEVLEHEIAPGTLAEARIWFPDPWHKKRHNKRRLIQPQFVELLASRMASNGLLHLATDWQAYAEHMLEVMEAAPAWRNQLGPGQYAEKPEWRIETHFERRGLKLGHGVWDLLYRKI